MVENLPVLLHRRAGEDRNVGVSREVARASYSIHQLRPHEVRRVDVAKEVYLECGVDGDDSQAADDLRVVRDLLRTQDEMLPEESYIAGDLIQYLWGDGERGSRGERASLRLNQV
jgi:hypothetical protein